MFQRIFLILLCTFSFLSSNEISTLINDNYSVENIRNKSFLNNATSINKNTTAWIRLKLKNTSSENRVIKFNQSIFIEEFHPSSLTKLDSNTLLVSNQHINKEIFIKTLTNTATNENVLPEILSYEAFKHSSTFDNYFYGFYFGLLFIIVIYNIQWYINTKEKSYLYYVLLQLSMIALIFHINGFTPNIDGLFFFVGLFVIIFSILFSKEFLEIKKRHKKINNIINTSLVILIFTALIMFATKSFDFFMIPFSLILLPFLFIGYKVYKEGLIAAKYFLVGWGLFIGSIFIYDLNKIFHTDILSFNHIIQVGNIFEAIMLSFALSYKMKMIIKQQNEKDKMLIQQSRLASMGEMLTNIAHQWRQPLNRVASFIMNMQIQLMSKDNDKEYLLEKLTLSQKQLEYMSHTIDDFANFFSPNKTKKEFDIQKQIDSALCIIHPSLISKNIDIKIKVTENFSIFGFEKEFSQVILNLLQNAKDAFDIQENTNKSILIIVNKNEVILQDNAGGIRTNIIENIFDPYFTTKDKSTGTGLGLYMSKMIIENSMNGSICVKNIAHGACFRIRFN